MTHEIHHARRSVLYMSCVVCTVHCAVCMGMCAVCTMLCIDASYSIYCSIYSIHFVYNSCGFLFFTVGIFRLVKIILHILLHLWTNSDAANEFQSIIIDN